eukprot:TRINITY_DN2843_c2_g1_i2.p2 TRINITY_DN2843_c2_g1~~TRINITY_DN2843_c2_g1_i2.p2  ORF type:complete len:352 (+),score=109.44 TRINITY_DN2843_c2_g1_i2:39-1058(+)
MVEFNAFLLVLTLEYVFVLLLCLFQITRIVYFKHNRRTYHFTFLLFCTAWCTVRSVYFFFETLGLWSETSLVGNTLLWLPIIIQFATFALLVLFYATLVHREKMTETTWWIMMVLYALSILVFLAILLTYLITLAVDGTPEDSSESLSWPDALMQGYSGCVFLILVGFLALYGMRLHILIFRGKLPDPFHLKGRYSNMRVLVTTAIIVVIYFGRSIYDFLTVADVGVVSFEDNSWETQLIALLLYSVWELLPVSLVVFLFWQIPRTTLGVLKGGRKSFPAGPSEVQYEEETADEVTPLAGRMPAAEHTFMPYSPTPLSSTSSRPSSSATRSREPSVSNE